jgi:hypothetical protein
MHNSEKGTARASCRRGSSLTLGKKMQPDFSTLFRKTTVEQLRYRVRAGACAVHDVQFLSSYLHDAHFTPAAVLRRGKKITIKLERDCWEFGYTRRAASSELHIAKSRLSVAPISGIRWESSEAFATARELCIESIYLGPSHWERADASELVISAPHGGWKLVISIADDFGEIRLDDLELPFLHSARKA